MKNFIFAIVLFFTIQLFPQNQDSVSFKTELDELTILGSIRADDNSPISKNWKYIPDIVKPYFMKKIVLVGPESTGKTVLSEKLSDFYGTKIIPEYGREYVENLKSLNKELSLRDFDYIALGHIEMAQKIAAENIKENFNNKMLIFDTDVMTTKIWSEIFCGESSYYVNSLEEHYIQKGDLYLLMDIDVPWIDDGLRFPDAIRKWHFNRIKKELIDKNLKYHIISGNYDKRLYKVLNKIDSFRVSNGLNNKN